MMLRAPLWLNYLRLSVGAAPPREIDPPTRGAGGLTDLGAGGGEDTCGAGGGVEMRGAGAGGLTGRVGTTAGAGCAWTTGAGAGCVLTGAGGTRCGPRRNSAELPPFSALSGWPRSPSRVWRGTTTGLVSA